VRALPAAEFRPVIAPVAIIAIAALALWFGPALPASLAGLKEFGAYFVLLAGAGVSLWFNRGRAFVAAGSLLLAYAGYDYALGLGADSFAARAVYAAAAVLVPLNVLVALLLPERGVSYHGDHRWLFIVAGEILLGPSTPFSAGNYAIGVPAALPTNQAARAASGITVLSFLKASSVAMLDEQGLAKVRPVVEQLGTYEGFPAHVLAVTGR